MRRVAMCYKMAHFEQIINSNNLRVVDFVIRPVDQSYMYPEGFSGVVVYDSEEEFIFNNSLTTDAADTRKSVAE